MSQTEIPFLLMRGGTSRGPYLNRADLPENPDDLAAVLLAIIGSGHPLNIDGLGGGVAVTTKVAMLSRSDDPWADIDYLFAQVSVEDRLVDFNPTCGNILSGVAPAAIEMGLIDARDGETPVNIRAVNTGAKVAALVQTPGRVVSYAGDTAIDGVPGTSAPVALQFMETVGGVTGAFLPTGNLVDVIDGIEVTCMDVAMPMVIASAASFGLSGHETAAELDENRGFFAGMEALRLKAGELMGMGDVSRSVTPKFGLVARPAQGGTMAARYFTPWKCHPAMAVTGAQCLASCVLTPGTVADMAIPDHAPAHVVLEHACGTIEVVVDFAHTPSGFEVRSAGMVRTARKIAAGKVFVPAERQ